MAPTDDNRRQMARILRDSHDFVIDSYGRFWSNGTLFGMSFVAWSKETIRNGLSHLADLIEPAPTSSDSTPTSDPTERGIDSIYDWCFSGLEGADAEEDYLYCTIMSAIEEYEHPERVTARTARPVDRGALLALADGIVDAVRDSSNIGIEGKFAEVMRNLARDIRDLCGEEAQ